MSLSSALKSLKQPDLIVSPRFSTLQQWLDWQEQLHPSSIDLGLERVGAVADTLQCRTPAPVVITVGGTNGKGSSVAMLESILRRAGYRVGCYTSPHLFRYNERLRINGEIVADEVWCEAFARIDLARKDQSLTYFEFGTLAALDILTRNSLDVVVLEVGLGGRLDAVNIVDADASLVTSIGLDHMDWLGDNRDQIAMEKAGIFRAGCPAICGDADPPETLRNEAKRIGARWMAIGEQFQIRKEGRTWSWEGLGMRYSQLPQLPLPGFHQLANAASVLMVLASLQSSLPVSETAIVAGLRWVELPARVQRIAGRVEQVLDVSHNAHAAVALIDALRELPIAGATWAVIGMLGDKDRDAFVRVLDDIVQHWCPVSLNVERAASSQELEDTIRMATDNNSMNGFSSMSEVLQHLQTRVKTGDRVIVCGSFYCVAQWCALNPEFG